MAINIDGQYETWVQPDRKALYDFILQTPIEVIVCEQFITSNIHSHKWGILTTEIVGGIEAIAHAKGIPFHRRTNHHRLPYVTRATTLIRAKRRTYEGHEVAALAHLLGWEKYHLNEISKRSLETPQSASASANENKDR